MAAKILLDVNVLIALTEPGHTHHLTAQKWFESSSKDIWGICPFTEAGFLRIATDPVRGTGRSVAQATAVLRALEGLQGFWYWPVDESWVSLTARFAARISGHKQVTDAYLLGLAIRQEGVLVTFDRGLKDLAGDEFARNVHLLAL